MKNRVVDIAEYMLTLSGEMPVMKLHSLLYLGQGASMHALGEPLFDEPIVAAKEGFIVPALVELHGDVDTVAPGFFYAKLQELEASAVETLEEEPHVASQ